MERNPNQINMSQGEVAPEIRHKSKFLERTTIPLESGELEVFIREDAPGIFSFLINVRSFEEAAEHEQLGDEYYKGFVSNEKSNLPITGTGEISGLTEAYRYLRNTVLPKLREQGAKELWIDGDEKRISAYRYLARLGFEETVREKGGPAYVYRFKQEVV